MCFSATASFAASAALGATGVVTMKTAKKKDRLFASMPILFAVQQFFEGLVWVLPIGGTAGLGAAYAYLFFALLFWPVFAPVLVRSYEKKRDRRLLLQAFLGVGLLVSFVLLSYMLTYPLDVVVVNHHLVYDIGISPIIGIGLIALYIFATCGSLLASSRCWLRWFGFGLFLLALLAAVMSQFAFPSLWCFFAAVLSGFALVYLKHKG